MRNDVGRLSIAAAGALVPVMTESQSSPLDTDNAIHYTQVTSELARWSRAVRRAANGLRKVRTLQSTVLANGQAGRPDGTVPQKAYRERVRAFCARMRRKGEKVV